MLVRTNSVNGNKDHVKVIFSIFFFKRKMADSMTETNEVVHGYIEKVQFLKIDGYILVLYVSMCISENWFK